MPPYRCRYIPSDKALVPPPIITTSKLLSAIYSLLLPPTHGKKARFAISILSSVYLQQPQFLGARYLLRLLPPLLDAQVIGHRIGNNIARTPDHTAPGIGGGAANIKVIHRGTGRRTHIIGPMVTHLERMVLTLLDPPFDHVGKLVLHICGGGDIGLQYLVPYDIGGVFCQGGDGLIYIFLAEFIVQPLIFTPLFEIVGRHRG